MLLSEVIIHALLLALALDWLIGDPEVVYRRLSHPVVLMGRALSALEQRALAPAAPSARYRRGRAVTVAIVLASAAAGVVLQWLCLRMPYGWVLLGALMSTLIAQKSLADHVRRVADGLEAGTEQGRAAVARIVGRDPEALDRHGVARAAIESLAENFSDGVVAPVFWAALVGLPGLMAYKMINTADSMIGHRSERYRDFGRFAARLDDVANWIPARLAGGIIVVAAHLMPGTRADRARQGMMRDARRHRSPNAGWPEAAMAGALGIRLAGPRSYGGESTEDGWMGDGTPDLAPAHIHQALCLFTWACALLGAVVLALSMFQPA